MTIRTAARFRSDGKASRMYWGGGTRDASCHHYVTGSQIVQLSDQPIKVILNLETVGLQEDGD